eukprot:403361042
MVTLPTRQFSCGQQKLIFIYFSLLLTAITVQLKQFSFQEKLSNQVDQSLRSYIGPQQEHEVIELDKRREIRLKNLKRLQNRTKNSNNDEKSNVDQRIRRKKHQIPEPGDFKPNEESQDPLEFPCCPLDNLNCHHAYDFLKVFKAFRSNANEKQDLIDYCRRNQTIVIMTNEPKTGLANHMFHYAAALNIAQEVGGAQIWMFDYQFDWRAFDKREFKTSDRDFGLDQLNIQFGGLIGTDTWRRMNIQAYKINERNYFTFDKTKRSYVLRNYFQYIDFYRNVELMVRHHYISTRLYTDYQFYEYQKDIKQSNSVCMHFRLGDYIYFDWILPFSYQQKAIELILDRVENPKFFVFTDSVDTIQQNSDQFFEGLDYVIVSKSNLPNMDEFELIRNCKYFIKANSSYSFWAVYLADYKDKIVISPFPSFMKHRNSMAYHNDFLFQHPKDWILLYPFEQDD